MRQFSKFTRKIGKTIQYISLHPIILQGKNVLLYISIFQFTENFLSFTVYVSAWGRDYIYFQTYTIQSVLLGRIQAPPPMFISIQKAKYNCDKYHNLEENIVATSI